jgi:Cupredoxin-like domain
MSVLKSFAIPMLLAAAFSLTLLNLALAADSAEIRFEDHQFKPLNLTVPTGQPLTIKVINASNETIEFESFKLNREKAISPGESIIVRLPALSAGNYDFYDDFHQDVPQGSIVAK